MTHPILGILVSIFFSFNLTGQAPVAVNDFANVSFDGSITIDVTNNDTVNGNVSIFKTITPASNGIASPTLDNKYVYEHSGGVCDVTDSFSYSICNQNNLCDTAWVFVEIACVVQNELTIYDAFSPNGDNTNDYFLVDGLDTYESKELTIYNRFGNQVYFSNDYKNDWGGTWDERRLPDGVYYYVFVLNDGQSESKVTGRILIYR